MDISELKPGDLERLNQKARRKNSMERNQQKPILLNMQGQMATKKHENL